MSLMLIKRGIEVLVGAALMVALLTVLPAVAQAHEEQEGTAPASVVVSPGDTLWSIAHARLGSGATPAAVAALVEAIWRANSEAFRDHWGGSAADRGRGRADIRPQP